MKILIVGNGINLANSKNAKNYNILSHEKIYDFLCVIGFLGEDTIGGHYKDVIEEHYPKDIVNFCQKKKKFLEFSFQAYLDWLEGPRINDPKSSRIFNSYKKTNNELALDLELLAQLYFTSKVFKPKCQKREEYIKKLKKTILNSLPSESLDFTQEQSKKINNEYDLVITTNYDLNLENSGIDNVFHAHGSILNYEEIEIIVYKRSDEIYKEIKKIIDKNNGHKDISFDIFGISLFNENHIVNLFKKLYNNFNFNFKIKQYIHENDEKKSQNLRLDNILLKNDFGIGFNESFFVGDFNVHESQIPKDSKLEYFSEEELEFLFKISSRSNFEKDKKELDKILEICRSIEVSNSLLNPLLSGNQEKYLPE